LLVLRSGKKQGGVFGIRPNSAFTKICSFLFGQVNFLETQKMAGAALALVNHNPNYETELYTTSYNETTVIYKPTHEYGENETAGRAIVVAWHGHAADYEAALDKIPYDYIYAPSSFPHNRPQWTVQGAIGLYIFHADPGIPYSRPLYSQLTA
jgi:hypothetical protein